jgi:putative hemolysin
MNVWIEIAIVVGLVLVNGFFALAEMAVVSSRRLRLQAMAEDGSRGAVQALNLLENPNRFLSGVQVGITGISVLSGALGGATLGARLGDVLEKFPLFTGRGHEIAVALVVVAITMLSLIVGELLPKRIALSNPERIAANVARPLQIVVAGARPLVWLLEKTTEATLALLKIPEKREDDVTEEEVKLAIAEGTEAGVIHEVEQEMMHGVLRLADNTVTSVMTPRPDVFWIDLEDDPKEMAREIADCPYSRLVVARGGDLGRPLGVVQKKDLVADLIAGRGIDVQKHLLEPIYLPENISVLRVLEMFRAVSLHIAFVVDEYGDFLGLVTLADVLGAVAGDMPQEHEPHDEAIKRRADGTWLVDGRAPIEELITRLDLNIESGDYHTAAGLALDRLARIPAEGDRFVLGDWRVEIIDMDGKRIDKLLFIPPTPAATKQ